jgi:hypothetical protein
MLDLATIAFNVTWLVEEQIRLLRKYLADEFYLTVFDNSSDADTAIAMETICDDLDVHYERLDVPEHRHDYALNVAAERLLSRDSSHLGFLDHDVFPTTTTSLMAELDGAGFYGVGQRHAPTDALYIWPGFFFMSRAWLDSKKPRTLDFSGIRCADKADDGDCGSMNAALFSDEDWRNVFGMKHGYGMVRPPDNFGLQSYGYEVLGDWVHLSNGSGWMRIPKPLERETLTRNMVSAL